MIFLCIFVLSLCEAKPAYSGPAYSSNGLNYDKSYGGAGGDYGYAGSFSGAVGFPAGNVPSFVPQFDLSSLFEQLNRQHQALLRHGGGDAYSYSYTSSSPGGISQAQSSIIFDTTSDDKIQSLVQGQAQASPAAGSGYAPAYQGSEPGSAGSPVSTAGGYGVGFGVGDRGGIAAGFGGAYPAPQVPSYPYAPPTDGYNSGSFYPSIPSVPKVSSGGDKIDSIPSGGYNSGSAFASGFIGPNGGHQIASVFPENPSVPNISTRLAAAPAGRGGGGFRSVFSSSKSVSNNINGKPQSFREASTTVNDNGKITTYTAHDP